MNKQRYRREITDYIPDEWRADVKLKENILNLSKFMILNDIKITPLGSYTSEETLYKYGKVEMDLEGLKVYILSSVIPLEPNSKMFNIDLIIERMFEKDLQTRLMFEIENLEEKLEFEIHVDEEYSKPFIKRLIKGEFILKGKYCSEIFVLVFDEDDKDNMSDIPDLVMYDNKECEKLYILPLELIGEYIIGLYKSRKNFLPQLVCSKCQNKVKDVYFQISTSGRQYPILERFP